MKFSTYSLLPAIAPTAAAVPLLVPREGQSPNLEALFPRQAPTLWVWACNGPNFTGTCGAAHVISQGVCYSWSSLFPGIGNGSFRTNSFALWFYDGAGCTGTQSNRICDPDGTADEISYGNYWYTHTASFRSVSTKAGC